MILHRIKTFILHGEIGVLIFLPALIGFSILVMLVRLEGWLQPGSSLHWGLGLGLPIFIWFTGLGGVVQIIRKETYGPMRPIRGFLGVISGILMVVPCWGASIYLLVSWIIESF